MFTITDDKKAFAKMFDQSLLLDVNKHDEYVKVCEGALKWGFACVAVNGFMIKECAEILKGSDVRLTCATSFPLGICSLDTKLAEAQNALDDGATDIDWVYNISKILDHDWKFIEKETKAIVDLCKDQGKVSKVIFETCHLNDDEITALCNIANEYKPNFVKTSTGTHGPIKADNVKLMRKLCLPEIGVKASGGVRSLERAEEMIAAGADRLGTVTAEEIMADYIKKYCK